MPSVMQRDPVKIPRAPGVFCLFLKSQKHAYVAFTSDLQKRSHSLAHMLVNPKTHWSIKGLPKAPAGEFIFTVIATGVDAKKADRLVTHTENTLRAKKYRCVGGARSASPLVNFKGNSVPLTEAMRLAKTKAAYIT